MIKTNPKAYKFEVNDSVKVTKYKKIFSKGYTKNWSREIFILGIKDLNREKTIRNFYE